MGSKISTHSAGPGAGVSDDEDRISILPDHLLHYILSFIPAQDAVRTGVLSRRWQRVWIEVPTFAFSDDTRLTAGFADSLDKVLARSRSHIDVLKISIRHPLHMARANVWLQQAVERVHGSTSISFVFPPNDCSSASAGDRVVLDLPCGGRTTALSLDVSSDGIGTLGVPRVSAAVSSSLTELSLKSLRLDGSRFSDFVSSCCPHLRKLFLHTFGDMDYLRLSNDALEDLDLHFTSGSCRGLRQLQVSSRNLRRLRIHNIFSPEVRSGEVHDGSKVARFRTPRLEDLFWTCSIFMHPSRVEFADSLATVRRLDLTLMTHAWVDDTDPVHNKFAVWLLRNCTGVRFLTIALWNFARGPTQIVGVLDEASLLAQYEDLMAEVPLLSSVSDLTVMTMLDHHAYGASIASLLSRCNNIETLTIIARDKRLEHEYYACVDAAMCWCKCPTNWRQQKLNLDFLRQVNFRGFTERAGWVADLVILLRCSRPTVLMRNPPFLWLYR